MIAWYKFWLSIPALILAAVNATFERAFRLDEEEEGDNAETD